MGVKKKTGERLQTAKGNGDNALNQWRTVRITVKFSFT